MLPSVYKYLDYRQYFTDVYKARKKLLGAFSYRAFARLAGSSSPNFFQLIQNRSLNINKKQLGKLCDSLSLDKEQCEYLYTLVDFDHAKTHKKKDEFFQKILLTREYKDIKIIENRQYDYLSNWYNPVVRELIVSDKYNGKPEWIAKRITPAITESKIKKSIELLETLELIKKDDKSAKWVYTDKTISTPSEVISVAVVKYHHSMIKLASESIERFGSDVRDVRSVTLSVSDKGRNEIKQRMEAFWKELLAYADEDEGNGDVMQVNMQLFPVAFKDEKRGNRK